MKSLSVKRLNAIIKSVESFEKNVQELRTETARVLGPSVNTKCSIERLAEGINDRIETLNRTGRSMISYPTTLVTKFMKHESAEVRAMAANTVPNNYLGHLRNDKSSKVRAIVASRSNLEVVKEMMKTFPSDDQLRDIYRSKRMKKRLLEASKKEEFDLNGEDRMSNLVDDLESDLTDEWYTTTAERLYDTYDSVERRWVEQAVANLVNHTKQTSGVVIDAKKLISAIESLFDSQEKSLSHLAERLMVDAEIDEMTTSSRVHRIVESRLSHSDVIKEVTDVYDIRYSNSIPVSCTLPHDGAVSSLDESALDLFVEAWNSRQKLKGSKLRAVWNVSNNDAICFKVFK